MENENNLSKTKKQFIQENKHVFIKIGIIILGVILMAFYSISNVP